MAVQQKVYGLHDIVEMKKPHACQTNRWEIIRMGMDIRIKCEHCGHLVLMPRNDFNKKIKKVLVKVAPIHTQTVEK
ncbi:DUF951 family protein [Granulicatella sp. zg-ZJ]|uniref:DUF951 domain-containing protein n=1 Tax=unclassified Granulicatella TaxID=2630493 RepID=UPI0013BF0CEC|nr:MULTISPECIES: DUF951 domain-containing protein [unclassified Granulicatella]NEW62544.1 DUF951 family protein [Granulicatella sp. zg-ZJ]NEW66092.1 DUF951 family protein [Granulicatella sp. zg-84]QMI85467.1 DUF951 domain-containing protein [Carnobacteriaceae bacterium zg-84]